MSLNRPLQSTVTIQLHEEYIQKVVNQLIESKIPFSLTYAQKTPSAPPSLPHPPTPALPRDLTAPKTVEVPSRATTLEQYIKRLMSDFSKELPPKNQIAADLGMSPVSFLHTFKRLYGKPFYTFYMEKRMEHAAELLKKGYKCSEVTLMVGYGKTSAIKFSKMFQKHFGMTPKKYQMEHYGRIDRRQKL